MMAIEVERLPRLAARRTGEVTVSKTGAASVDVEIVDARGAVTKRVTVTHRVNPDNPKAVSLIAKELAAQARRATLAAATTASTAGAEIATAMDKELVGSGY